MNGTLGRYAEYCFHHVKHVGKLWYFVDPNNTTLQFHQQVPDYYVQVWVPFFILIIIENIILATKNGGGFQFTDHVTSLSHWMLEESGRILFRGSEYLTYIWIYERYKIWNLPWDSVWTWYLTALGVDFCYYFIHRVNHEVHFLWAQHQVHHSSEEFHLVVGLRQSFFQHWFNSVFYLPLALFIPPSHFITHIQFNIIYQFWIHTTVIKSLGPLELIFNTPKHHRVHHGSNLYCLDKNYGGVLIVWDKLFGTFQEERPKEEIIYGLVVSPRSFNPLYLQTFYTKAMIEKCWNMETLSDKLSVIWKGPSWLPGLPRLGLDEYKVNVTSRIKHQVLLKNWQYFYVILHFLITFHFHWKLCDAEKEFPDLPTKFVLFNNAFTLINIGLIFDDRECWSKFELLRCSIFLLLSFIDKSLCNFHLFLVYSSSCCISIYSIIKNPKNKFQTIHKDCTLSD